MNGEASSASTHEGRVERSFIHGIVHASLKQPLLVATASVAVVITGVWSFTRLPVDAYPDLSPPQVELSTQWPGHAAEEVERLRQEVAELHERVDFAERLLSRQRDAEMLPGNRGGERE